MKMVFIEKDIDIMGGVERIINTLSNEFCKKHEVAVISEHKNKETTFFKYDDRVSIYYIQNRIRFNNYKKNKITGFLLKISKLHNSIKDYFICKLLSKDIYNCIVESDCIVFGRVNTALNFLPLLKKIKKDKKIIVRDAIHLDLYNSYKKILIKKYFPVLVDYLIVSSDESLNTYKNFFGENSGKLHIIKIYNPLGITPSLKSNIFTHKIVSLGRLDKQKGLENLILAFKNIVKKHSDWKLEIYGEGPEKKKIINIINDNELQSNITIKKPTKDVSEVFSKSSIYVMTSRYEGYANTLVEALVCGVPSISYDWKMGVNEIIEDKKNGLIVKLKDRNKYFKGCIDFEDIKNLEEAIEKYINDTNFMLLVSKNSTEIIKTRNIQVIIKEWKKIIN